MEERIANIESSIALISKNVSDLTKTVKALRDFVIIYAKHNAESFIAIDDNFEIVNEKVDAVNKKVDKLIAESSKSFSSVGNQLDDLQTEVKKIQKVSNYSEEYDNLLRLSE